MKENNAITGHCPYCDSKRFVFLGEQADVRYFPTETFSINRCLQCSVLFTLPRMNIEELKKYYPESYGAYNVGDISLPADIKEKKHILNRFLDIYEKVLYLELQNIFIYRWINYMLRFICNLTLKHSIYIRAIPIKKGRLLYIGSGNPEVFARHKQRNVEIHIIDINKEIIDTYNKNGFFANHGTVHTVSYPDNYFDVIYFTHVIEHFIHPKQELKKLGNWLKADGTIICGFPVYNTLEWNYKVTYYDVPRHRIHLEKKTIKKFLKNANLKAMVKLYLPYGQGFHQNNFYCHLLEGNESKDIRYEQPVSLQYRILSLLLSFFKQSGDALYYIKKMRNKKYV